MRPRRRVARGAQYAHPAPGRETPVPRGAGGSHNAPMAPPPRFDLRRDDPAAAREAAAAALERGELVVVPTETVYGLAGREDRPAAHERLEAVKPGRDRPYSLAVASPEMLADRLAPLPRLARRIADRWWPGPVTQLLPLRGGGLVGVRVPGHAWTRELIEHVGVPLLLPSANRPGEPAPRDAASIDPAVIERAAVVVDGGHAALGEASTVLEPRTWVLRLAREGVIGRNDLARQIRPRVLIACSGNTCRSPIAQHLLARELERASAGEWLLPLIESAGLQAMPGLPATDLAIEALAERGLDLSGHVTRPVDEPLLGQVDLAFGLTRRHVEQLRLRAGDRPLQVELFDPEGRDVEDPFGGTPAEYRSVTAALERIARERARLLMEDRT